MSVLVIKAIAIKSVWLAGLRRDDNSEYDSDAVGLKGASSSLEWALMNLDLARSMGTQLRIYSTACPHSGRYLRFLMLNSN